MAPARVRGYKAAVIVRLVRCGLWLLGFASLWLPLLDDPPLQSGAYVQDVREDSAVVAMVTATPAVRVLRVLDGSGKPVPVPADATPRRRHEFHVTGLQAGARYSFTVADAKGAGVDEGSFRTPPRDDRAAVRFCVVGDSGGQPWWVWLQTSPLWYWPARWQWLPPAGTVTEIGAQVAAAAPQFVLHVGDVVYPWGHQGHYSSGFFRPFAAALRSAPFYVALGNHDVMDDDGRQALANFVLPRGELTGDERCYAVHWGSVCIVVLDLNDEPVDDRHPAVEYLRRQLPAVSEPWLLVASHYPIRSASRQGNRADLMLQVAPLLRDCGVDLYLSGHDHTYQRFAKDDEVPLVVSGGGGKSLYEVHPWPHAVVTESRYHWCQVDVAGGSLRLQSHAVEGGLLDTLELRHDDPQWLERLRARNPARAERIAQLR